MKKYNITFDQDDLELKNSRGAFEFIAGTAKEEDGYKKEFDFTMTQMYLRVSDTYSFEITWLNDIPEETEELESEIISKWEN